MRSAGPRCAAGPSASSPSSGPRARAPRARGHALLGRLGARRDDRARRAHRAPAAALRGPVPPRGRLRPAAAPAPGRAAFDAVHSLGRHDAVASIRAARLRGDGRRTVITDLGLPDPVWWRQQGRREARAAARRVVRRDRRLQRHVADRGRRTWRPTTAAATGWSSPAASIWRPSRRPPSASRRPTILFSGAITEPRKGVAVLLAALALIAEREPEVRAVAERPRRPGRAARRPPRRPLASARRRSASARPTRQPERYGRAWVTCLPSTHDSFGMALLESLACGTPLVTTTHSAPQELVAPGVTGELCAPEDPAALAGACLRGLALARGGAGPPSAAAPAARPYDWDGGLAPLCERLYRGPMYGFAVEQGPRHRRRRLHRRPARPDARRGGP